MAIRRIVTGFVLAAVAVLATTGTAQAVTHQQCSNSEWGAGGGDTC